MTLDEQALLARFRQRYDLASNQVLTSNKPSTAKDESKPWCRYHVSLGDKFRAEMGENPAFTQLGGVYLQIFIPKALGLSAGDAMFQDFDDLFTEWTSPDGHLQIGRRSTTREEQGDLFQVTVRFAFESLRKRQ